METNKKVQVNIRRAGQNDIDTIIMLDRRLGGDRSTITYRDLAATSPGGPLDLSFIAEIDGKIVGFILARITYVYIPFIEVCLINGIVVDPDYQHQNIGKKLVNELLNHCEREEINTIRALVDERDEELKRFMEGLGFIRSKVFNYDRIRKK